MVDALEKILENVIRRVISEELDKLSKETPDEIFNQVQACGFLGISKPTFNKHVKSGEIPVYRIGERKLFKRSELLSSLVQFKLNIDERKN